MGYLQKYTILESVGDYNDYLELIGSCLGVVRPGAVYFDCGCGSGLFGAWCLRDLLTNQAHRLSADQPAPVYFALDLTAKGLSDAARKHFEAGAQAGGQMPDMSLLYYRYDLDDLDPGQGAGLRLPFQDASIDRICCSLLISYLSIRRPFWQSSREY